MRIDTIETTEVVLSTATQHSGIQPDTTHDREIPTHFRQSLPWGNVVGVANCRYFESRNVSGELVATSVLHVRRSSIPFIVLGEIARGPAATTVETAIEHLQGVVNIVQSDVSTVLVNPYRTGDDVDDMEHALRREGFVPTGTSQYYSHTLLAEVSVSDREQWRTLRRSTRTAINKSRKLDIEIVHRVNREDYANFATSYSQFAKLKKIPSMSSGFAKSLYEHLASNKKNLAFLLSAECDGTVLGQILLVRSRDRLTYEWGWTSTSPANYRTPIMHPLIWEALRIGRDYNCQFLDMGGYWNSRGDSDPINHFKLGFTKNMVRCGEQYELFCSKSAGVVRTIAKKWRSR